MDGIPLVPNSRSHLVYMRMIIFSYNGRRVRINDRPPAFTVDTPRTTLTLARWPLLLVDLLSNAGLTEKFKHALDEIAGMGVGWALAMTERLATVKSKSEVNDIISMCP